MYAVCAAAFLGLIIAETSRYSTLFAFYFLILSFFGLAILFLRKKRGENDRVSSFMTLFAFATFLFIIRGQFIEEKMGVPSDLYSAHRHELQILDVKQEDSYTKYRAVFTYENKVYEAYLLLPLYPQYKIGEIVVATTSLQEERKLFNNEKTKSFDYEKILRREGIVGVFLFPQVEKVNLPEEGGAAVFFSRLRADGEVRVKRAVTGEEGDLVAAMLLGSHALSKHESELFQNAGISHIVALSGFNLTVLMMFLASVFFFLPFYVRIVASLLTLILYLFITDLSGSLLRAAVRVFLSMLILVRGRVTHERKVLLASYILLAALFPDRVLFDVSLHLSYLAMVGVLFVYPALFENYVLQKNGIVRILTELTLMNLAVVLAVAPYSMIVFQSFTPYGILGAILVTPLLGFITVLGLITLVISYIVPFAATLCGVVLYILSGYIFFIAYIISHLPYARAENRTSLLCIILYYTLLLLFILYKERRRKYDHLEEGNLIEGDMFF